MNLFMEYSEKEMEFLASLPKLIKKRKVNLEDLNFFKRFEQELNLFQKMEFELPQRETHHTNKIIYVIEGELGVVHLREIIRKLKKDDFFGVKHYLQKKDYKVVALKPSYFIEIELDLTPSAELAKVLVELCRVSK
ncbi:MAG: hypothetical protein GXO62_01210 [Epsilonproteobacteria bacterium]|nr:hypothetical protein [Campylobacterota bacterium]